MRHLARSASENVFVKLSGLASVNTGFRYDEQPTPPTSAQLAKDWAPYVKVALEVFGVRRCMFASNFPVDKGSADYTILWNAFKLIAKDLPLADRRALFSE